MTTKSSAIHSLKTDHDPFQLVWDGLKLFEWRKNDRDYKVGDVLVLREHERGGVTYLGRKIVCVVTSMLEKAYDIPEGYCVLGIAIRTKIDENIAYADENLRWHTQTFVLEINKLVNEIYDLAVEKGWWPNGAERNVGEIHMLIVEEVAESHRGHRKHNPESDKIPGFTTVEEELADVLIRIFDLCGSHKLRLAEAVLAKHEYNKSRPHRHGGLAA